MYHVSHRTYQKLEYVLRKNKGPNGTYIYHLIFGFNLSLL